MPRKTKEIIEKEKKTTKKATTKKSTTKKTTAKKQSPKAKATKKSTTKKIKPELVEYYDLPLNYNKTVVKILYQTPTTLFVYWEISKDDIENYKKIYGDNFFETTRPILIVYNDTLNYSFEIDINDFANSWYFNVKDSNSNYRVELGRKSIENSSIENKYIYVSSSNTVETPNNKVSFENYMPQTITFKNVKSNEKTYISLKDLLKSTSFAKELSKSYNIKISDLYNSIYQNENTSDLYKLINPSSK